MLLVNTCYLIHCITNWWILAIVSFVHWPLPTTPEDNSVSFWRRREKFQERYNEATAAQVFWGTASLVRQSAAVTVRRRIVFHETICTLCLLVAVHFLYFFITGILSKKATFCFCKTLVLYVKKLKIKFKICSKRKCLMYVSFCFFCKKLRLSKPFFNSIGVLAEDWTIPKTCKTVLKYLYWYWTFLYQGNTLKLFLFSPFSLKGFMFINKGRPTENAEAW